jgi:predicted MPP superfamily phosphohydrolase
MEAQKWNYTPRGGPKRRFWPWLKTLIAVFGWGLRVVRLHERGVRNALDIRLVQFELHFKDLPAEFDGFRILQLSDLHLDSLAGTMDAALALIPETEVDLCVLTGDYRDRVTGPFEYILPRMRQLVTRVNARHGLCAVLGNHDCADMVEALENLGMSVLVNETLSIQRAGAWLHVTGTDDVHHFYTDAALTALSQVPEGFKMALVHSAELADVAADQGFHLYLAGHTHGGQICLPGGRPILTNLICHRRYASGLWRHGPMLGYTTTGVGVAVLPVRFNCRGQVVLLALRRKAT